MTATPAALLDHVERGRPEQVLDVVQRAVAGGASVTSLVTDLLAPVQQLVGERWERGEYTISQEHAASAAVEDALGILAAHTTPAPHTGTGHRHGRVALVCATGEWHTTPARMAALGLRDAGWTVDFLGGSTPPDHVAEALAHTRPQALAVSATLPLSLAGVPALVEVAHACDVPVLAGGRAFGTNARRATALGADGHAADTATAAVVLAGWLDAPPARSTPPVAFDVDVERRALEARRPEVVTDALHALDPASGPGGWPTAARDLDQLLRVLDVAVLVDDAALLLDHVAWLDAVVRARGGAAGLVARSVEAVLGCVGADLPRSRDLLRRALDHCHSRGAD